MPAQPQRPLPPADACGVATSGAAADRPVARPTATIALASAAALLCFGVVGLWAGHGRQARVSPDAVVVDGGAAQVVVHPGAVVADPSASAEAGAALPDGWPIGMLPARFAVRSTGAVGDLLVVTGSLPRADVDTWTSSLVGVWGVTGRHGADATSPERLELRGGGVITVQAGDPALVEVILKG
ncbi:MAG: hypothetical protein U0Q15_07040 [Kineosporiaceae bacterium]